VARLDEGLARRLLVVCAPAGFGKTSLLADWARRGDRAVAWLSLAGLPKIVGRSGLDR
jgi:LuxR family maltose regulon positive regulatory protein